MAKRRRSKKRDLEAEFSNYWRTIGDGTKPAREHRGIMSHVNKRRKLVLTRHKFDFAFPEALLAIEIEGGIFSRGRHTRGAGYAKDCQKYNKAAEQGWCILRYTSVDIDNDPAGMIAQVALVRKRRLAVVQPLHALRREIEASLRLLAQEAIAA